MSEFFVGQRVVCVDTTAAQKPSGFFEERYGLRVGRTYTIRWIGGYDWSDGGGGLGIKVEGIFRFMNGEPPSDWPFGAHRFQPLPFKAEDAFRKIARDVSEGKTVELVE